MSLRRIVIPYKERHYTTVLQKCYPFSLMLGSPCGNARETIQILYRRKCTRAIMIVAGF